MNIERVFVNIVDYRSPDNAGVTLTNQPIAPGGPAAYFCTLPIDAMRDAVSGAGIAVEYSLSAGAYLCNHVAYAALHRAAAAKRSPAIGFVRVPRLPEQVLNDANAPSMDLATMIRAVELMIGAIVRSRQAHPC